MITGNHDMPRSDSLVRQVRHNCAVCDSRHAGLYSICGLALRLRDLYKWEKGLDPWIEKDPSEILEWIGEKEELWDRLTHKDFRKITINGNQYKPFDAEAINREIEPQGLFYGAGYVYSLKPSFLLAVLDEKREIDGHSAYLLGHELARDLLTVPALSQDNRIIVRKESGKLFFWNQIFFVKKSGRPALTFALEHHGVTQQNTEMLHRRFSNIFSHEVETYIRHELGEMKDTVFDRDVWREIIAAYPHTAIELLARTVKDLLADTNEFGTLRHICSEGKAASLGFYVAFLDGLRKELFPELLDAFPAFAESRDWQIIEKAVLAGYETAKGYTGTMVDIFKAGKDRCDLKWAENELEKTLLSPLGLGRGEDKGH